MNFHPKECMDWNS